MIWSSTAALERWLAERQIDTSGWGTGATKSVQDLLDELRKGEASLVEEPPRRQVRVVQVVVRRDQLVLAELEQELVSGGTRRRSILPAEKQLPGESAVATALRCLAEELGIPSHHVTIRTTTARSETSVEESPSYPGLLTQYEIFSVEATVEGLPEETFWIDEAHGGRVRRSRWGWVTPELLRASGQGSA